MIGFSRALWGAYMDGVIDFVTVGRPSSGIYGEPGYNPRKSRELGQARHQGFRDAKEATVMRRYEFTRERLLIRAEATT